MKGEMEERRKRCQWAGFEPMSPPSCCSCVVLRLLCHLCSQFILILICYSLSIQVHLSDLGETNGTKILASVLWNSSFEVLNPPVPAPKLPTRTLPRAPSFVPQVVVKGVKREPRVSNPYDWTVVGREVRLSTLCLCIIISLQT